ncbi:MAG: hypothetical protein EOO39_11395 [Cytophagaceae bacterium]|nr:MAG: hypothetical protein EOO39_11395 [Cytophagaceae bacterium]
MSSWLTLIAIQVVINLLCHTFLVGKWRRRWTVFALFAFPLALIALTLLPLILDTLLSDNISVGIVWGSGAVLLLRFLSPLVIQLVFNRLTFRQ